MNIEDKSLSISLGYKVMENTFLNLNNPISSVDANMFSIQMQRFQTFFNLF